MIDHYDTIKENLPNLLNFLNGLGIDAALKSHLENDFLMAMDYIEKHSASQLNELTCDNQASARAAIGGLNELYKWVWSIKGSADFEKLLPHFEMLAESATRINDETPMMSPVTGKQDDKTNKLIETLVAMFAVKVGSNLDLDDPEKSSGGENPDVMFEYQGKKIAVTCKTLRGKSPNALLDNLRSAARQIRRADCDRGYIAINTMNILPHEKIASKVFPTIFDPIEILRADIDDRYISLQNEAAKELDELFADEKVRPVIINFVHSTTRLSSSIGNLSTMIKTIIASPLRESPGNKFDMELLNQLNEFIHQRL